MPRGSALSLSSLKIGAIASEELFRVEIELGAGIGDVEIAHGELADAVAGVNAASHLLHAQPLRLIGEIGALGVQDRIVVAASQLERDLAGDGASHPTLGGSRSIRLEIEPPPW